MSEATAATTSSARYSFNLNNSGGWITYTVPVTSANFMPWPGQTGTTSFAHVAANPVWAGLLFTSADFSGTNAGSSLLGLTSTNGATISIDNFGGSDPAPMPPAFLLIGPRIAALAVIRRKWRR